MEPAPETIRLGISSCLLGENVRWNGGHKLNRYIRDTLGQFMDFVPVCPEVECGLGVPRETLRLKGAIDSPRLVTTKTGIDHTDRMQTWAAGRVKQLEKENLHGFIFKKDSPSSGLMRVKVYSEKGMPQKKGVGIFARAFTEHFPNIPVEEEGRLNDPRLRENFIEQVFSLKRWRDCLKKGRRMGVLVDFHTRNKMLILSHSQKIYRDMGRLVARGKKLPGTELFATYEDLLLQALSMKGTAAKHGNVMLHMMGYFKKQLSADEKQELLDCFADYRQELVPLIVPLTLLKHYVRKYRQPYLSQQTYLNPHPVELKLRNHV
jgi:uncharacterized protein YbgA (DUF1722 family)/uncharacterized protein YbbK (DUF523 family)